MPNTFSGTARPDGMRSLDIYFGRNGQHLTVEIDNWRDGDLGITIPAARAYNTFTSGNGLSDRIEDVPPELIQAVLREQGLITEITPPDGTTPDPDAPPADPNQQRRGSGGDDLIAGMGGNDTLTGGAGRDTLRGNDGDDTYTFASGDGIDTIEDAAGQNTIQFRNPANTAGTAITLASVTLVQKGRRLRRAKTALPNVGRRQRVPRQKPSFAHVRRSGEFIGQREPGSPTRGGCRSVSRVCDVSYHRLASDNQSYAGDRRQQSSEA